MLPIQTLKEKFGAEGAFIVLTLRAYFGGSDGSELTSYLAQTKLNWPLVSAIISEHDICPLVYKGLPAGVGGIPDDFTAALKAQAFQAATANLANLQEGKQLLDFFRKHGVKIVPYKGVVLSFQLFGDFISRKTSDIDFLVLPEEVEAVTSALQKLGYQTDQCFAERSERHFRESESQKLFTKQEQSGFSYFVEIQWRLLPKMFNVPLANSALLTDLATLELPTHRVETLNIYNTLLSTLCHHGVNDGWRTLKLVADVAAFVQNRGVEVDWNGFPRVLRHLKIKASSETGFSLAAELFGVIVPPALKRTIPESVYRNLFKHPRISNSNFTMSQFFQQLSLRDSRGDKSRYALNCFLKLLFIPNGNDFKYVRLPGRLFFLYYLIKPFRLLVNQIRGTQSNPR